mgnify:CR=1 FL=1
MKQNLLTRVQAVFLALAVMLSMTVPTFGANASDISVTLNKNALFLTKNATEALTVTVRNGESTVASPNVYFLSSDTNVVDVTERTGVVTAKSGGAATITARYTEDGKNYTDTCAVTVTVPAITMLVLVNDALS